MFSGENSWATSALNEHLAAGAQLALDHCQEQFKWDRWNCPKSAFSRWVSFSGPECSLIAVPCASLIPDGQDQGLYRDLARLYRAQSS